MDSGMLCDPRAAIMLTGFAVGAGILAVGLPHEPNPRLRARLRSVAR
jgi:hypothetical protein